MPPLRERVEDIPSLVDYFVRHFATEADEKTRHIGKRTLGRLQRYHWPGNIRELQNVVERTLVLSEADTFDVDDSWRIFAVFEGSREFNRAEINAIVKRAAHAADAPTKRD